MPDRFNWYHKLAPSVRPAIRQLVRRPKVLNDDLLDLPLAEDREQQAESEEQDAPSETERS